mgnify:CR=1 FL=1
MTEPPSDDGESNAESQDRQVEAGEFPGTRGQGDAEMLVGGQRV